MQYQMTSVENTLSFASLLGEFILNCRQKNCIYPRIIYLNGELGAGKTTFTRGFVSAFPGAEDAEVGSPSFTLCHEYPTNPEIYHADLYRLQDSCELPQELQDLPKESLLLLEWGERLANIEAEEQSIFINFVFDENPKNNKFEKKLKKSPEILDNFDESCEKKRRIIISSSSELLKDFLQDFALLVKQNFLQ